MKNGTAWVIGILIVLGVIYYLYAKGFLNGLLKGLGISPVVTDPGEKSMCNDTGNDPNGRVNAKESETCTPPVAPQLFLVFSGGPKGDVKENKWTADKLVGITDLLKSPQTPDNATKIMVNGKEWTFNQIRTATATSPEYYLFVDNPVYPNRKDYPVQS